LRRLFERLLFREDHCAAQKFRVTGLRVAIFARLMPVLLKIWIVSSALLCCGGWVLSLFGALNRAGYAVLVGLIILCGLFILRREVGSIRWRKFLVRFRRPAPLLFAILTFVAILGGALYLPVNVDEYSYRLPRVLHWLALGRWHWIYSADVRLNVVTPAFDWLSAPVIVFTKSERCIFLINSISYLFLPGLVFGILKRLGVGGRVAWWWMWILPAGFCYSMQAGSVANDAFGAIYALAAIDFALRAREGKKVSDVWYSTLAIALATGAKQSNLPLGLPWLIAIFPAGRVLLQKPVQSLGMVLLAGGASALPTICFNMIYAGSWSGFPQGHDYAPASAFWGIVGNSIWVFVNNILPPIFPWAAQWNEWREHFMASNWGAPFRSFEEFGYVMRAASEQYSGIGSLVFGLLLLTWLWGWHCRSVDPKAGSFYQTRWVRIAVWLSLMVFFTKIGINQIPRYVAPFYPLLFPTFLSGPGQSVLVRRKAWRVLAYLVLACTIALLALSRQRPIWPADAMTSLLIQKFPNKPALEKVRNAYTFAHHLRSDMAGIEEKIPASERIVGYAVRFGDKEPWLWKPLWSRRVERILNNDSAALVRRKGIRYVLVDPTALINLGDFVIVNEIPSAGTLTMTIEQWMKRYNAELVLAQQIRGTPDAPPTECYLVRLKD
jgi:hypothetical protein